MSGLTPQDEMESLRTENERLRKELSGMTIARDAAVIFMRDAETQRDALADALMPFYLNRAEVCDEEFMSRLDGDITEYGRLFLAAQAALRLAGRLPKEES